MATDCHCLLEYLLTSSIKISKPMNLPFLIVGSLRFISTAWPPTCLIVAIVGLLMTVGKRKRHDNVKN